MTRPRGIALLLATSLLLPALAGCGESWQRKFVRKNKKAEQRPSPIVRFQDYSQTMTPLERYRKHYLMFEYWDDQLRRELADSNPNAKRFRHSSQQSWEELARLQQLLLPARAEAIGPLVTERGRLNGQLQAPGVQPATVSSIRMAVEAQHRQIGRDMNWRDIQEFLNGTIVPTPAPSP